MTGRPIAFTSAVVLLSACASGPPSPPALAYGQHTVSAAVYDFSDTTSVDISVMGQAMQLSQHGEAEYAVAFADDPAGVGVTLAVRSLSVRLNQPMGEPVEIDESSVRGDLAFSLDRVGDATVTRRPAVADEASQMISGLSLAHTFFPALPGRATEAGDSWVDTLSYSGDDGPGSMSESSVLSYTVAGDTVVDGRSLLLIEVEGTTTSANDMEFSGMPVSQESELAVRGYVLWDPASGIMFEQYRESTGSGVVSVPVVPAPLPVSVRTVQRARLQN
jgi:hypothetical protein